MLSGPARLSVYCCEEVEVEHSLSVGEAVECQGKQGMNITIKWLLPKDTEGGSRTVWRRPLAVAGTAQRSNHAVQATQPRAVTGSPVRNTQQPTVLYMNLESLGCFVSIVGRYISILIFFV